jgi:hypothetical protein
MALCAAAQTTKNSFLFSPQNSTLKLSSIVRPSKIENKNAVSSTPLFVVINSNYYTQHFGFFCKKELALQKALKAPLFIRLGSLQQCNYLEGKK